MSLTRLVISLCLVSLSQGLIDSTVCPKEFLQRCTCGMSKYPKTPNIPNAPNKFIVNCTNTGFKNASMLKHLPEVTEVLIFTGNDLGELPKNILGSTDFDSLDVIDMSNNHITFIPGKAFHRVYNVRTLILNHNDIQISERERPRMFFNFESLENLHLTNAFTEKVNSSYYLINLEDIFYESDLSLLLKLHLEQNEIATIGKNASIFCQLPSLQQLYLGDNRLSDIDFNLHCTPDITYIDLQRNSINQLSVEAMEMIDKFKESYPLTLELQENPFMCDCYSSRFITWLKTSHVQFRDEEKYRCADAFPRKNVGRALKYIDTSELKCENGFDTNYSYPASTVATLSFLLAFVLAILLAIACYHRVKVKTYVLPYWEHVTRKVGYSGLANEEVSKAVAV